MAAGRAMKLPAWQQRMLSRQIIIILPVIVRDSL